jgi:hypothetical protein
MKKLLFSLALFPLAGNSGFNGDPITKNLAEVRTGAWPINLERWIGRRDTSYALIFRDEAIMNGSVLDTLPFPNIGQLRYFQQALDALKKSNDGETANFTDYSLKKSDSRIEGTSYILRYQDGETIFKQPEADILRSTIKKL